MLMLIRCLLRIKRYAKNKEPDFATLFQSGDPGNTILYAVLSDASILKWKLMSFMRNLSICFFAYLLNYEELWS